MITLNLSFLERPRTVVFSLLGACLLLMLLWLPGAHYPVASDVIVYALLGRSVWETGAYELLGEPMAKFLPLYPIISYPFSTLLGQGMHTGMHLLALLCGFGVVITTFLLTRFAFGTAVAFGTVIALVLHPGFVLMTMLASADLFFTFLVLLSLWLYLKASEDARAYVLCGIALGLACLTRYNGVPLLAFLFVWTLWKRPVDRTSKHFWSGVLLGSFIISLWFLYTYLMFGSPFHSEYTSELQTHTRGHVAQLVSNFLYYMNPAHNIFFFLFPFSFVGLYAEGRRQKFLIGAMLSLWVLTAIWWVQGIRFAFPGYPILLAFSIVGLRFVLIRFHRATLLIAILFASLFTVSQGFFFCIYTYGACNAWFDRTVGLLPPNIGLTSEGFYSWQQAREFVNVEAENGAWIYNPTPINQEAWKERVFRQDLKIATLGTECPVYEITQREAVAGEVVAFETSDAPITRVVRRECRD